MEGYPVFWTQHVKRLTDTLQLLDIDLRKSETELKQLVVSLLNQNGIRAGGTLRLTVYRSGGGKYFPETNEGHLLMECMKHEMGAYVRPLAKTALLYDRMKLPVHELGNHKTLSKTIHINAAIFAQKRGVDDAILLNSDDQVTEAVSSNLFLVKSGKVVTPNLESGCLNGTIRKILLSQLKFEGVQIHEEVLTVIDLEQADEIWTTNAITGIKILNDWNGKRKQSLIAERAQQELNELAINSIRGFLENLP